MKIKAIYLYLGLFLWVVILGIILKTSQFLTSGLGMSLTVLTLVTLPGLFLLRISKIESNEFWQKLLYIIGFGFVFYFLINLLALLVGLSLNQLTFSLIFFLIVLFGLSIYEDRREILLFDWEFVKKQNVFDWIFNILIVLGGIVAILGVNAQSDKLIGDGAFHLSIINKVVNSTKLSISDLWVTKSSSPNLVYSFPVWHIFMGFISKLLNISIFTTYIQVIYPMVIIFLVVSYGLLKTIFKNIYQVRIGFLSLIILGLSAGVFYTFVPLRSPDSLARLILLPLLISLSINYFYKTTQNTVLNVALISLLAISMGLIHFTQLIGYILILFVFFIVTLIINFDKVILKKIGFLAIGLLGLTVPYLLVFQSANLGYFFYANKLAFTGDNFPNKSYHDSGNIYLYIMFSLPLIILYLKKNKNLIMLLSITLALFAVSWRIFGLRVLFLRYFGDIFTTRALTDIPGYIYFGVLIFTIIWIIYYLFSKTKFLSIISYILLGISALLGLIVFRKNVINFIDYAVFSPKNDIIFVYFVPILVIITVVCIIIYLLYRFVYKRELPDMNVSNPYLFGFWAIFVLLLLSLPYFINLSNTIKNNKNGSILSSKNLQGVADTQRIGGSDVIKVLATLEPGLSFVTSNVTVAQNALMYTPAFAGEYPFGIQEFTYSTKIFNPSISLEERTDLINQYEINYIISINNTETELFLNDPANFELIFTHNYSYWVKSGESGYNKSGEFTVFKYSR